MIAEAFMRGFLEKLAVTTQEMEEAGKRIRKGRLVRIPDWGEGPAAIPKSKEIMKDPETRPMGGKIVLGKREGSISKHFYDVARSRVRDIVDPGLAPRLGLKKYVHLVRKPYKKKIPYVPKKMSRAGHKALRDMVLAHEGFELRVPEKRKVPGASHRSPAEVLSKEHNLLARLKGPGAEEVKKLVGAARRHDDAPYMKRLLGRGFGPRAVEMYRKGEKFPRAMRKALVKKEQAFLKSGEARTRARKIGERFMRLT